LCGVVEEDALLATGEVRGTCLESGIEIHGRDANVEVVLAEHDVFMFVRGGQEEEDED
jgi:hypothetical protein